MYFRRFSPINGFRPHTYTIALSRSALCAVAVMLSANAGAVPTPLQPMTFSVDVQGPTAGTGIPDSFTGIPIRGTDILTPFPPGPPGPNPPAFGPLPPPGTFIPTPGFVAPSPFLNAQNGWGELDALSYGRDPLDYPSGSCDRPNSNCYHIFSVDEFAIGLPGSAVRSEGALGNQEAAADTFITPKLQLPTPPLLGTNAAFTDGDGLPPSGAPGVGLIEPNPPTPRSGGFPGQIDPGDNLDALDMDTGPLASITAVYVSGDSAFIDPLEEPFPGILPPNYGTAAANGFVGGDVAIGSAAGLNLYAAATQLGLDIFGTDTDDLDALKLHENGIDGYQASITPFDWLTGATDMLLFSVRRGSSIIGLNPLGLVDSIFGIPIEEGDILTTPCPAGTILPDGTICVGGPAPGIFVSAEALGLATVRSGTGMSWGVANENWAGQDIWADDLDAYDQKVPEPGIVALLFFGIAGLSVATRRRSRGA